MVIPTKIKNIKKRQRRTDSTEESEQASQAPPQKQCTFRSNVLATVGLLSTLKLNNAHVALLKQTPFWLLIDAIRKGKLGENAYIKHDKPILAIIEKYDTNDSKFLISGKKVALTRNDIRLIFGICCGNIPIVELKIKKKDVAFATRRGITEARIGSRKIKDMINELLNKEEAFLMEDDIRDVVRLICMFICLTLFFSTSGVTIAWTYVDCMENIEQIKDYDWAQSIADTLNASMHKFHAKPRDATGCVMALMFWFCEHTNLIARPSHESIPRILNWNTSKIKKAFDDLEDFSNANITVNDNELEQTRQEDDVYTMAQPEVEDMEIIPSPQPLEVQQHLYDVELLPELEETSTVMLASCGYEQPQSAGTMVQSPYQVIDSIAELNQFSILEDVQKQLEQLQQQNKQLQHDKDTFTNELEDVEEERASLQTKILTLEDAGNAMQIKLFKLEAERDSLQVKLAISDTVTNVSNDQRDELDRQLLELERERDSLKDKLQNMDNMSTVLKQERDELEKQLLAMEKERDSLREMLQLSENKILQTFELKSAEFEQQKQLMLQQFEQEKNNIKNALTRHIDSLKNEKQQLQQALSDIQESQRAILVEKDAEITSLPNQLSIATKLSVEQQQTLQQLPAIKTASSKLTHTREEPIPIITQTNKIPPLQQNAKSVLTLLPYDCFITIKKFWKLEEGSTPIWDCELPELSIFEEDVRFLLCDNELTGQAIDAYVHLLTSTQQPQRSHKDIPFVFTSSASTTLGGQHDDANRAMDEVASKLLRRRTILFPIFGSAHYTLLELDTIEEEWRFYNSIRKQSSRKDTYYEKTSKLRLNVTSYINKLCKKNIKATAKLLDNTPQQQPGSVDCGVVVAYIIQQKLLGQPVNSNLKKEQCRQLRADIVRAFFTDPIRSWTPELYKERMEMLRLQKEFDEKDLIEQQKNK